MRGGGRCRWWMSYDTYSSLTAQPVHSYNNTQLQLLYCLPTRVIFNKIAITNHMKRIGDFYTLFLILKDYNSHHGINLPALTGKMARERSILKFKMVSSHFESHGAEINFLGINPNTSPPWKPFLVVTSSIDFNKDRSVILRRKNV